MEEESGGAKDKAHVQKSVVRHAVATLNRTPYNLDGLAAYQSVAYSVRDMLSQRWNDTQN